MSGWVQDVIASLGAPGLFALMVLENLFPPIPSEVVLPLAGFLVGRGELGFAAALVASTLGSLVGALCLYALGRWGGRGLVLRYGAVLRVKEADLAGAERRFGRYDEAVVFFGRMVPGLRSVVSIPAGTLRMPLARFAILTAAGAAIWDALLLGLGWYLGANWERVAGVLGPVSGVVLGVALLTAAVLAFGWWRRRAG